MKSHHYREIINIFIHAQTRTHLPPLHLRWPSERKHPSGECSGIAGRTDFEEFKKEVISKAAIEN